MFYVFYDQWVTILDETCTNTVVKVYGLNISESIEKAR